MKKIAKTPPIGCALEEGSVKLSQLQGADPGHQTLVTAACSFGEGVERGGDQCPQTVHEALRSALASREFIGSEVVTCLTSPHMTYRRIRLAPMPEDELDSAVHWQVARELTWGMNDFRSGFYEMGDVFDAGKRRHEVVAVAASVADLDAHAGLLKEAGLTPLAIDTAPGALARCLNGSDEPWFVIDLGMSSSILMVVRNGQPRLIRLIPLGRQHIVDGAAELLGAEGMQRDSLQAVMDGIDSIAVNESTKRKGAGTRIRQAVADSSAAVAREMAHEVTLSVHYLSDALPGEVESRVGCIVGGGSQEQTLTAALTESSAVEFRPLREILSPQIQLLLRDLSASPDEWLLPLGLALYGHEASIQGAAA